MSGIMSMSLPASGALAGNHPKVRCILVVEDHFFLRYTLSEWLRHAGYNVVEASSADEAVTLLVSPFTIDLVITDIDMPGRMNGYDLVEHLKKISPTLPVIMVSGKSPQKKTSEMGISQFFLK